ncbi:MAG: hypothetical protein R3323_09150 [Wenzhouxiangellaceae bacterium]|nr:hypothetical protein [Wenzhouxiangellaceae bacterium]
MIRTFACLLLLFAACGNAAGDAVPVRLDPLALRVLLDDARSRLDASGPQAGAEARAARILGEPDPVLAEALASVWIDRVVSRDRYDDTERKVLRRLEAREPAILVPHHEHPGRWMPALQVGRRAANLLDHARRLDRADVLADDGRALREALLAGEEPRVVDLVIDRLEAADRPALATWLLPRIGSGSAIDRAALRLGRTASDADLLQVLVEAGNVDAARAALLHGIDSAHADLALMAESALGRPEIGGLAVSALLAADPEQGRDRLWGLLGSEAFGADAARRLAAEPADLVAGVEEAWGGASPLARLRMRLALQLAATPETLELAATIGREPDRSAPGPEVRR